MRITQNSMTRNYLSNLNSSLDQMNASGIRQTTGRKFTRMSQAVSSGTRALNIRSQLYKNVQIQKNIKSANESLTVAEGNMMSIEGILNSVHEQTLRAVNGTMGEQEHEIYSMSFDSLKEEVVQFANCKYNDTYILGGTNNKTVPFTVKDDVLYFNGVEVSSIEKVDGKYMSNGEKVPYSDDIYIDIGIGMSVKNGEVDPRTAFKMSVSGLGFLGYGKTEMTYKNEAGEEFTTEASNNVFDLLGEMSQALKDNDLDKLGALNDHLRERVDSIITDIADVGVRTKYLDTSLSRNEDEEFVLTEIRANLEQIEDTDELVNYKSLEYSWLLTLQFGSKILPQSLMDYLR